MQAVFDHFSRRLRESRRLADDAYRWSAGKGAAAAQPIISDKRKDSITELAFLRAFLAWELFLEHAFLLYISGQKPSRGRVPKRYYFPPSQRLAMEWLAEGREYSKWADASDVASRAVRFFKDGFPFTSVLRSNQVALTDANCIRNFIAHESSTAREKFEKIVRRELGALPVKKTAGSFLGMTVPGSAPPISFLESYLAKLEACAYKIIP